MLPARVGAARVDPSTTQSGSSHPRRSSSATSHLATNLPRKAKEKKKENGHPLHTCLVLAPLGRVSPFLFLFFSFGFFFVLFFGHGQRAGEGVRTASPPDRHWKPRRPTKSERRRKASKSIQLGTERKEDKRWEKTDTNVSKPLFSEAAFSFFYFFCHGVL